MHETQATTASDDAVDSATETAAIFGSASEADADGEKRDLPDQAVIETRWRPKLHPPPPPPRQIHRANLGYWNNEAVASRISLDIPHHRPKRESCRPGQHINGCVSYATAGDLKDVPIYDGTLERFDKDKNSGTISSRGALADFKQNVYVHGTVLHSSKVCLKDRLCFRVHMNAHGKPQASRPLLRLRANEGYALSGTFTVAAAHSGIAGTIHCQSVSQLFDEDVQVSHEVGRQLQTGDRVNFNARWIYEDNDGKLEDSGQTGIISRNNLLLLKSSAKIKRDLGHPRDFLVLQRRRSRRTGLSRTFRHLLGLVSLSQRPSQKRRVSTDRLRIKKLHSKG